MTSLSLKKLQITAQPHTAIPMLTSLILVGCWGIAPAMAQGPSLGKAITAPPAASQTMHFTKEAAGSKPTVIQTSETIQDLDSGDTKFKLPASVVKAVDRATRRGEAGLPDADELFSLRSEAQVQKGVIEEAAGQEFYGRFPEDYEKLSKTPYAARRLESRTRLVEPNFICHHRLFFEEKNAERYGYDLGPIQPFVSTAYFIKDLLLLPYHFGTRPHQRYETSAGNCLPGDAVPYILYPFEISASGALLEAGVIVTGFAVLP